MMSEQSEKKVGIISCSGEGCVEGTISRIAARLVLERLRPDTTVTICLPLFLAGGREERTFARDYPTITVDGCKKLCAKIGTEHYSGKPASSIIVSDFTPNGKHTELGSRRTLNQETLIIAEQIAERIAEEVDKILECWE
jgi:uncharacterized metal-binding protein